MTHRRVTAAALPILVFLLWLIVGRAPSGGSLISGLAVALAVGAWAPVIDL
jgi:hypothetical protein